MKPRFSVEFAIWHSTIDADIIGKAVGIDARISWSSGDPNRVTGGLRDRTYCRFDLGLYTQEEISNGLIMLKPFQRLADISEFNDGTGTAIAYFKNVNGASELHINLLGVQMLSKLNASVAFR